MNQKNFNAIVGTLFAVVGLVHLVRSVMGWEVVIGGWVMPVGISVVAFIVLGYLSYTAFTVKQA